jgi:serine/threonine protein kinase
LENAANVPLVKRNQEVQAFAAHRSDQPFAGEESGSDPSNSPTLSQAATLQGVILGTAAYMSPEQARGKAVNKRTDIWAFGCVLYELLTGKQAFQGETGTEILAAVLR